ncbi:MAG: hypothetical protein AB4062_12650 [Crocosphaera sp.]
MIRQSLSLVLGIVLSLGAMETPIFAHPRRIRSSSNPGIHRTIIAPSSRIGNSYQRRSSYYRGGSYSRSRERIIIERDQQGYCNYCGYSNGYSPYRRYRDYGRTSPSFPRSIPYYYHR